jgi:hypothetical protein
MEIILLVLKATSAYFLLLKKSNQAGFLVTTVSGAEMLIPTDIPTQVAIGLLILMGLQTLSRMTKVSGMIPMTMAMVTISNISMVKLCELLIEAMDAERPKGPPLLIDGAVQTVMKMDGQTQPVLG